MNYKIQTQFKTQSSTNLKRKFNRLMGNPYVLIAPGLIITTMFTLYPFLYTFINSFYKVDIISRTKEFVFLSNYQGVLRNSQFQMAFMNSIKYTLATVVVGISLALVTAVFLNKNKKAYNFVQNVVFSPHIVSWVSISVMFVFLMDPAGILNQIIMFFGGEPSRFFQHEDSALNSIILVAIWKGLGYNTLIIIAGLQKIPQEVYEAARLDKAGQIRTFFKVTIPMLAPTLLFLTSASLMGSFSTFEVIDTLTQGGPRNSTTTMVYWIYNNGFVYSDKTGMAFAGAILFIIFVLCFVTFQIKYMNRWSNYEEKNN